MLLTVDPYQRLGYNGIRSHQWMSSVNWYEIEKKQVEAPYKPIIGI